jgi:hypothetical protein
MPTKKTCFLIAPIGEEGSDIRQRSDKILKYVVEPPASEAGYEVVRADKIEKPGIITSQVIQYVLNSDLVIADLTGWNPNVFYELALRHAIRKPYIQIIGQGERIPFDVAGVRTLSVDHTDLDSVDKCKKDIGGQIRALENSSSDVESPVSVAVEIESLKRSAQPVDKYLAEIRETLSRLAEGAEQSRADIEELTDLVQNQEYRIEEGGLFGGGPTFGGGNTIAATGIFGGQRVVPVRPFLSRAQASKLMRATQRSMKASEEAASRPEQAQVTEIPSPGEASQGRTEENKGS